MHLSDFPTVRPGPYGHGVAMSGTVMARLRSLSAVSTEPVRAGTHLEKRAKNVGQQNVAG